MSPAELVDLCTASIDRWRADGCSAPPPSIMLVMQRPRRPTGRTIALLGSRGPRGRIAIVREAAHGYDVVAYFPATAVLDEVRRALRSASPVPA